MKNLYKKALANLSQPAAWMREKGSDLATLKKLDSALETIKKYVTYLERENDKIAESETELFCTLSAAVERMKKRGLALQIAGFSPEFVTWIDSLEIDFLDSEKDLRIAQGEKLEPLYLDVKLMENHRNTINQFVEIDLHTLEFYEYQKAAGPHYSDTMKKTREENPHLAPALEGHKQNPTRKDLFIFHCFNSTRHDASKYN